MYMNKLVGLTDGLSYPKIFHQKLILVHIFN